MKYALYVLKFDTPVHFGCAEDGGKLEQSTLTYRADSLFSAICCELANQGHDQGLDNLYHAVATDQLVFSDLFPYFDEVGKEKPSEDQGLHLYVPKPIVTVERNTSQDYTDYREFRKQAVLRKKQKKFQYIRASKVEAFMQSLRKGTAFEADDDVIRNDQLVTRVNCTADVPRPYYVHHVEFSDHAGLYGIVGYEDDKLCDWLMQVLSMLGLSGIGGKRSSGYGKFHFEQETIELDARGIYADDSALYRLLTQPEATTYMCLSALLPAADEIPMIKAGQYSLCRRSGFLTPDGSPMKKRQEVYMIQAGSCFSDKVRGTICDVGRASAHPVWRYGKGLYAGLIV